MKRYIIMLCASALMNMEAFPQSSPLGGELEMGFCLSQSDCRRMALAHNEKLAQADNAIEQAELDHKIAATAALPKLDGMAMGVYGLPNMDLMGMTLQIRGTYLAGINLTQPLYVGGKITAGKRLAIIGEKAAREQRRMTQADIIVEADRTYFSYVAVLEKLKMMNCYKEQMDTLYAQTETAVKAGMATPNDLLRISAKRSEIGYQLQKVRSGKELCRLALCNVIGKDCLSLTIPHGTASPQPSPGGEGAELPSAVGSLPLGGRLEEASLRPELSLLAHQISADKEQIRIARADMLPTVALSAGYSYYGNLKIKGYADDGTGTMRPYKQDFSDGTAMLMLSLKVPIFHWGETAKKIKKAKLSLRNSELELQRTTRLLSIEAEQAARNLEDSRLLISSAEITLRQATENLRVMRNRYSQSMSPLTDLLDAQSQWQQAESNLIEAQTQQKLYETEYLRATGQL